MSRATKRKHVINELLNTELRIPNEKEVLCRIVTSRGNNLHEVETSDNEVFLASMPSKFRHNVWVKRGDFVLLERIDEGNKVKGEIMNVLTRDHIKYYKSQGVWPNKFDDVDTSQSQVNSELISDECYSGRLNERIDSDSDSSESSSDNDEVNNR